MNKMVPMTIQEAIQKLRQYGFQECTETANKQNDTAYLCAFERSSDEKALSYCCATEDDLFALLSLVEASVSQ